MSPASEMMRDYVWPEIGAMMSNDAHFRLVLCARQLTKKFNGPTAKLLQDEAERRQLVPAQPAALQLGHQQSPRLGVQFPKIVAQPIDRKLVGGHPAPTRMH